MNALFSVASMLFPLITFPYVSRVLNPSGLGKVGFATSVIAYFTMFASLGIPTYGIRACAEVRDDKDKLSKTAHELIIINLIMTAIIYVVFAGTIIFVPRIRAEKLLFIVLSVSIILGTIGIEWLYKALEEYTYITIRSLIFKVIALVATFLLVHSESDYVIYGGITIFATSASNILNFINAHKYINLKPYKNYNLKRHFKLIGVFFAMACSITIYTNLDSVMLGFIKDDTEVGYYNAAVKLKGLLVAVITSLGTVLLPRASYYMEHGMKEEFNRVARKAINFVFILALPLMVYFMIFAKESVLFLSGKEFVPAIPSTIIITPTIFFIGLTNILGMQILVPSKREKQVFYSTVLGAVVDLILNIALIPQIGSAGAAIGTLIAELAVLIYQYIYLRREVGQMFRSIKYYAIILALLASSACATFVKFFELKEIVALIISAIIFFGIYGLVLIIFKEPLVIEIVNQIIGKIRKKQTR